MVTKEQSAFPHPPIPSAYSAAAMVADGEAGMTLRDWFAGQALSSYSDWTMLPESSYEQEASALYAMADAMLKAREK